MATTSKTKKPPHNYVIAETHVSTYLNPSPFLPPVPNMALGDLGHVVFPGVRRNGEGLLTPADRDPRSPQNAHKPVTGDSTYTREATTQRVGGNFRPRVGDLR